MARRDDQWRRSTTDPDGHVIHRHTHTNTHTQAHTLCRIGAVRAVFHLQKNHNEALLTN